MKKILCAVFMIVGLFLMVGAVGNYDCGENCCVIDAIMVLTGTAALVASVAVIVYEESTDNNEF